MIFAFVNLTLFCFKKLMFLNVHTSGLVCESVGKSEMLSAHWWKAVQGPYISAIHLPSVSQSHYLCLQVTGGVGSGFLWWHWLIGYVSPFLKKTADVLAPRIAVVFRGLPRLCSFTVCWRVANVTPIPKGPSSSSLANYRQISSTPILFLSVWCLFVLGILWNAEVCCQPPRSLMEKVLALVIPFCVWHTHYGVHWSWGIRIEWFRSTSVLLLSGSTIKGFF